MEKTSPPPPYSAAEDIPTVKLPEGAGIVFMTSSDNDYFYIKSISSMKLHIRPKGRNPQEEAAQIKAHRAKLDQLRAEMSAWARAEWEVKKREKARRKEREAEIKREKAMEKERRKEWKRGRKREAEVEWSKARERVERQREEEQRA
ncbi:hypothetical protein TRV_02930 [Trichophyton verrucosum HKI 0517]|uniref:Uncharacterized protein n=1 Tax=Trichophyton verrucosum (strain HKI 0517) TaxID=663202 RepID=D4D751_TRIVH|nr:uncharacterized protein TRV_02930 [Trichophyton verrucosum HKI 0517]EFE42325.1 hypothetical protein TRV_02930 [Trichophyton verrucosum HKI 0517]